MTSNYLLAACFTSALSLSAQAADEHGHDHGAPAAQAGPASPRFSASSEIFELVGVVDGKRLTVYLDRFADNAPVNAANIDMEVGGAKVALIAHEAGEYRAELSRELQPGTTAVTATIVAGSETDLLAADLVVQKAARAMEAHAPVWRRYAGWTGAVVVTLLLLWSLYRFSARRQRAAGGVA